MFHAPQRFRSSETQSCCDGCFSRQFVCTVISLVSGMPRTFEGGCRTSTHGCQFGLPILFWTFCIKPFEPLVAQVRSSGLFQKPQWEYMKEHQVRQMAYAHGYGLIVTSWGNPKLQTVVYDILPQEAGAGKRCSECGGNPCVWQLPGSFCFVLHVVVVFTLMSL